MIKNYNSPKENVIETFIGLDKMEVSNPLFVQSHIPSDHDVLL